MKKTLIFFAIILMLWSCKNGSVSFYVNDSSNSTIEGQLPINLPFNLPIIPISSTNTTEYENNQTVPDLLEEVNLEDLSISITNPANDDFSFLKAIEISILFSDQDDNEDGVLIATLDNINSADKIIHLTPTGANLIPYLKTDSYKLKTKATVNEILLYDVDIKIDLRFKITAKLL
ncbi:MAG: hypothetical protein JXR68_12565 [Bacteroidales bacterium]|nr:hypothetical protein [Bacteroidales bacterium]